MTLEDIQMRTITVERYSPAWEEEFKRIKDVLYPDIWDLVSDIVHVGSTSVPGLSAKPIVDLIVIIDSYEDFSALSERLETIGYKHEGDGGILGREMFRKDTADGFMARHLYVCPKNGEELLRQTAFRNYLRAHPDEAERYGILKSYLAIKFPHDIDGYIAGKRDMVEKMVEKSKAEGLYGRL